MPSTFKRYEKKYFMTEKQYEEFVKKIEPYVKADKYASYNICNVYYDTDNWDVIRASIEKPPYKEKLRVRCYGVPKDGDTVFVEIKKKYKKVVYKRRVTMSADEYEKFLQQDIEKIKENKEKKKKLKGEKWREEQIKEELLWYQHVHRSYPRMFVAYDRTAYAGKENPDLRITFDTNMRYRTDHPDLRYGNEGVPILDEDIILMEIKIPDACPMWLTEILSEMKLYPTSFSKYGTAYKKELKKEKNKNGLSKPRARIPPPLSRRRRWGMNCARAVSFFIRRLSSCLHVLILSLFSH